MAAPGSKVMVRLMAEGAQTADWPLSRKLGLQPWGLSFHVGSQQRDITAWDSALSKVSYLFTWLKENEDLTLSCINMGGGGSLPPIANGQIQCRPMPMKSNGTWKKTMGTCCLR